jgi:hypothetical protein
MNSSNHPQRDDHTTGLPKVEELAEWLQGQPTDDALDFLHELACLLGWQQALSEARLCLLKPGIPLTEAVAA